MIDRTYAIIRTLESKIAIAERIEQNTLFITLDVLKEILAMLKEQERLIEEAEERGFERGQKICLKQKQKRHGKESEAEMGLTESHWFEEEDILNERQLEDEVEYGERRYQAGYKKGYDDALKKQEPILLENQHKPFGYNTNANSPWISRCPRCGRKIEGKQTKFCKYCGQAVKWE